MFLYFTTVIFLYFLEYIFDLNIKQAGRIFKCHRQVHMHKCMCVHLLPSNIVLIVQQIETLEPVFDSTKNHLLRTCLVLYSLRILFTKYLMT